MKKRMYLITGIAGFLGNTVARKLVERGGHVRGLVMEERDQEIFGDLPVEFVCGDVRDRESLEPLFQNPEHLELVLIHTASMVTISSKPDQTVYDVNVEGTKNLLVLCAKHRVRRMVHVSSVHAIPELPMGLTIQETNIFSPAKVHGFYAKTKARASELVLKAAAKGMDCCIVHPSGIIGPGDYGRTHLNQMVRDFLDGKLAACVEGGYDFVDVRDVAEGIISCTERGRAGECYILSGRYASVRELLDLLSQVGGRAPVKTVLPLWFARLTAPLSECYYRLLHQPPLYTAYSLYTLESNANFSHQKATEELGYHPRELGETLQEMVAWLREER